MRVNSPTGAVSLSQYPDHPPWSLSIQVWAHCMTFEEATAATGPSAPSRRPAPVSPPQMVQSDV